MSEESLNSQTYTVDRYPHIYNNYVMRSRIIPFQNKREYIKFITRFLLLHGFLRGTIFKFGALMSQPVSFLTDDDALCKKSEEFLSALSYKSVQISTWASVLAYDYTVLMYMPKQKLKFKCPECSEITTLDETYPYPFKLSFVGGESEYTAIRSSTDTPAYERRQHDAPLGVYMVCRKCGSEFIQEPTCSWDFHTPGRLQLINPIFSDIYVNEAGVKTLFINPMFYDGVLNINTELEYYHIDGLPWDLIKTYATRTKIYQPPREFYEIFGLHELPSVGTGGGSIAPVVSTISDLISVDIMKMGNEGIAFSKIDPLYIISPTDAAGQGILQLIKETKFRDLIVSQVKAHNEGDINRMIYSPIPVMANPLFGDGKRFMTFNEIQILQQSIVNAFGFDPGVLSGGSGIMSDPFNMSSWQHQSDYFQEKLGGLYKRILRRGIPTYSTAMRSNSVALYFENLNLIQGGLDYATKQQLYADGTLLKKTQLKDLGYPSIEYWQKAKHNEEIQTMRFQVRLREATARIEQEEMAKAQDSTAVQGSINMPLAKEQITKNAEEIVQNQLAQMDDNQIKSFLKQLQTEDAVLHAVVVQRWTSYRDIVRAQQDPFAQNGGGQ